MNLCRKYSLERMFSSQLLESAKDELSFRTVVRNLQTRSPMLQIVLINPNSWCSFGDCMDEMVSIPKINIYPMIKVLFSDCSNTTESQLRFVNIILIFSFFFLTFKKGFFQFFFFFSEMHFLSL